MNSLLINRRKLTNKNNTKSNVGVKYTLKGLRGGSTKQKFKALARIVKTTIAPNRYSSSGIAIAKAKQTDKKAAIETAKIVINKAL